LNILRKVVRRAGIRPVCTLSIMLLFAAAVYVNFLEDIINKEVYLDSGRNCFSERGISNGDSVRLSGTVSYFSIKESGGQAYLSVSVKGVKLSDGMTLTGPFETISVSFPVNTQLHIGQYISFSGRLSFFSHASNPGEFDMYEYYRNKGVLFRVFEGRLLAVSNEYSYLRETLMNIRLSGEEKLSDYLDVENAAILKAMIFGNKDEISSETKELFQKNGIAHILAISGLHISFLAMTLYGILKRLSLKRWICMVICTFLIVLYGIMVGFPVSAVRAVCMFIVFLLGQTALRTYDMLSAMSLALSLIVIFKPGMINDTGFMLSFMAVLSVGYLYDRFKTNVINLPALLSAPFISFFIFMGTLPILLCTYYEVALYSVLLNLVIIPLMSLLLLSGLILVLAPVAVPIAAPVAAPMGTVLSGAKMQPVGTVLSGAKMQPVGTVLFGAKILSWVTNVPVKIISGILWLYKNACSMLSGLSFGRINLGRPGTWQVIAYYLLLVMAVNSKDILRIIRSICRKKDRENAAQPKRSYERPCRLLVFLILIALSFAVISFRHRSELTVWQLDVGQGDCMVMINGRGNAYMIDGGSSSVNNVGDRRIIPMLKWAAVNEIDIFLTHPDMDHMSGIIELMNDQIKEHIRIGTLYVYEGFLGDGSPENCSTDMKEILQLAADKKVKIKAIEAGDKLIDGDMEIAVIYPEAGQPVTDTNNSSLVMKVSCLDYTMLTTGDVEEKGENVIANGKKEVGEIDVLKVAHHGSASSSGEEFLDWVMPKVALISVGKNNYGHPSELVLDRLQVRGTTSLRTDDLGCIVIEVSKSGKYEIKRANGDGSWW